MFERLVVAQINLSNFAFNIKALKSLLSPNIKMMAVVKGNAYGHGAVQIAKKAETIGVDYFGVVCLYEAKELREAGIKSPILLLNYNPPEIFNYAVQNGLSLNIMDEPSLKELDRIARINNRKAKIHVKIDTGMHRLGLMPDEALKFIPKIENYQNLFLEGVYSHFATSDEESLEFAQEQLSVFNWFVSNLRDKGIQPQILHIANSAAMMRLPEAHLNMVRPGKILYGLAPSLSFRMPFIPKPVLSLKTQIVQLRSVKKGESVGYGRVFVAKKETIVAVLPVGYADGFRRGPNNWSEVLVQGKRVSILGRVSMDQTSIDVSNIKNVKPGDEVVLIGRQGSEEITTWDVAQKLGTISYEVTSSIAARVSREYIN